MALNTERNNTVLIRGFDDIVILLRYLYMSENHKIVVDNSMCKLEIGLRPDLRFSVKNLNFPLLPDSVRALELDEMLAIIDQLEELFRVEREKTIKVVEYYKKTGPVATFAIDK